jgi:hypothetical protein
MTAPRRSYLVGRFICALYALGLVWAGTVAAAPDYAREKRWADEITPALVVGDGLYLQQASGHKFLALHTPAKNSRAAVIVVQGRIQRRGVVVHVVATSLETAPLPALPRMSRDFA